MPLYTTINSDIKEAMKSKDKDKLSVLRMIKSSIEFELNKTGAKEISDEDALKIIISYKKKLLDSIDQFKTGNREDLAKEVENELPYLMPYLPEQLSEEDVVSIISSAIADNNATTIKDMGKVMKIIMPQLAGKFDSKKVSELVKSKLGV